MFSGVESFSSVYSKTIRRNVIDNKTDRTEIFKFMILSVRFATILSLIVVKDHLC